MFMALRRSLKIFAPEPTGWEVVGFEKTKPFAQAKTSGGGGKLKAGLVYERKG